MEHASQICAAQSSTVLHLYDENNTLHNYYYHNRLMAFFPGQPGEAGTKKVKPVWIQMRQETMGFWDGCGISWTICK